jgi:ribulose-phosphate 3-epimerase
MRTVDLLWNTRPALSVGAISANLMSLGTDLLLLETHDVRLLHFDIMDGHFAPQLTAGPWFVKAVKTTLLKDVHLMIENPYDAIPLYAAAGADIITVHAEADRHVKAALQRIFSMKNFNDEGRGIACGIAINPSTPVHAIEPFLPEADIVTIIGINPGFGGQAMDKNLVRRVEQIRGMIAQTGKKVLLCVDGGVTSDTIREIGALHPDIVVSGSAVFENQAVARNLDLMKRALHEGRPS